jgi:hypothetical protein
MFTPSRITPLPYRKYQPKLSVFEFVKRLFERGFIGSAVDRVIGSDAIIAVTIGMNIRGIPSQGEAAKGNFKSTVARINRSRSRSSFFL